MSKIFNDSYLYDENQAHVYRPKVKPKEPRSIETAMAHLVNKTKV